MSEKRYKQLVLTDREQIEEGLNAKMPAAQIARILGVSVSSVTREIKRNRRDDGYRQHTSRNYGNGNICQDRARCEVVGLCKPCNASGKKLCSKCKTCMCTRKCPSYKEEVCARTLKYPYTCNGCGSFAGCRLHRFRYSARDAQAAHDSRSYDSRCGIDVTKQELASSVAIIKAGLKNNQGLAHIYAAHPDELAFSLRSCYRHIKDGTIPIIPLELPKQTRYKPRDKKRGKVRENMPEAVLAHRRYSDYLALDDEKRTSVVEMDCVVGPAGTKEAILTLHFKAIHFQIGIKLTQKDTVHVVAALNALEVLLGTDSFICLFGLILCDRGSEFFDVVGMERTGEAKRCSVYFCDPTRSDQKGSCEKNHVELRKVIPKGTSLEHINQYVLADVFSHVNSLKRTSLFGKSPMDLACAVMPEGFLDNMGYRLIPADDVMLSPKLIGM